MRLRFGKGGTSRTVPKRCRICASSVTISTLGFVGSGFGT